MIENTLECFSETLFLFLTGKPKHARNLLVKRHSENLQTHGEFSFPNSVRSWHEYVSCDQAVKKENATLLQVIGKETSDIVVESKRWKLEVSEVKDVKGRIYLFLERSRTVRIGMLEALHNNAVLLLKIQKGSSTVQLDPCCEDLRDLTSLRTKYVCSVIKNLCALSDVNLPIFVTSKSTNKCDGHHQVLCGTVLNSKSGAKETDINSDNFIRLRQDEMTLIAQHKYGVRVSTDSKWIQFIAHLGESAAAFELLQTRPSGAVKINFDCSSVGSSKGASFILYNCARLESIIRTFNDKVDEGIYPKLPEMDDVDFTLLTQEDDWYLIFNYILGLPSLLTNCVELNDKGCEFKPHQICSYLCSMVRVFSQYYRRFRILLFRDLLILINPNISVSVHYPWASAESTCDHRCCTK